MALIVATLYLDPYLSIGLTGFCALDMSSTAEIKAIVPAATGKAATVDDRTVEERETPHKLADVVYEAVCKETEEKPTVKGALLHQVCSWPLMLHRCPRRASVS